MIYFRIKIFPLSYYDLYIIIIKKKMFIASYKCINYPSLIFIYHSFIFIIFSFHYKLFLMHVYLTMSFWTKFSKKHLQHKHNFTYHSFQSLYKKAALGGCFFFIKHVFFYNTLTWEILQSSIHLTTLKVIGICFKSSNFKPKRINKTINR